jgi:hypothetical protein
MTNEQLYKNLTSTEAILEWEEVRRLEKVQGNQSQPLSTPPVELERHSVECTERPVIMWTDIRCGETFHYFKRDADGNLQAFHGDDRVCERAEFNLAVSR